jgi:hypothetical protein
MGLDGYLSKKTYVKQWDFQKPEEKYHVTVTKGGELVKSIDPAKISYVVEEVGYWRKVNAIHNWFVHNVQGGVDECQQAYVSHDQLKALLELVETVLADPKLAGELLPTQSGFFFGSTEYGEYYLEDLENTKAILTAVLADLGDGDIYYQSSW